MLFDFIYPLFNESVPRIRIQIKIRTVSFRWASRILINIKIFIRMITPNDFTKSLVLSYLVIIDLLHMGSD